MTLLSAFLGMGLCSIRRLSTESKTSASTNGLCFFFFIVTRQVNDYSFPFCISTKGCGSSEHLLTMADAGIMHPKPLD
jgi:hypothetical protein